MKNLALINKKAKLIIALLLVASITLGFTAIQKPDPEKDRVLISLLKFALTKGHYQPKDFNDDFSELVYKNFIKNLDPSKRYFLQSDIEAFSEYKNLIDDQIKAEDLTFFKLVYGRYKERVKEVESFYSELLTAPFNFNKKEEIELKYEEIQYAKTDAERIKKWQKELKLNAISGLMDRIDLEKEKHKKEASYHEKSFKEIEVEVRESIQNTMGDFFKRMLELNEDDGFSAFLNTITLAFDPHTTYFAPQDKKRFDISMAGKLEGIGARLQKKGDFTKVVELISGGPAWKKGGT